ncbi:MAG TPA: molybdopterin-dependent oxidoreductase [Desulfosporosinus sp.]
MAREIITTCTRDCPNSCGLSVQVEQGGAVMLGGNPRHPLNQGVACHKAQKFVQRAYSKDRILTPMRRNRKSGAWQRIRWDSALDEIAGRMSEIKDQYGAEAILYYRGFAQRTALRLLNERFFNLFGGVTGTYGTLCGGIGQASQDLDFGCRISHDPLDYENSRSLVLWGRNPVATNPYLLPVIARIRRQGGSVILIDPVASESKRICDVHIQPAPGKDAYLAMATAKRILALGREDREFLKFHSEGFSGFQQILDSFTLEELSQACDVPLQQIKLLADVLLEQKPTGILLGWGLHRWEYAHHMIRSIDALGAVAGLIGVKGGGVSQGFEEYAPYDLDWIGDSLYPDRRKLLMPLIGEEILKAKDPSIHMIFVTAGNPLCMAPNSGKVAAAFAQVPFVVVAGHFLDDTVAQADIFLPSTTFLEEQDIVASYGHNYVGPVNRAVAPLGESRSDFELFQSLAKRFPFGPEFNRSVEEWLPLLLAPLLAQGVTMEELWSGPVRLPCAPMVPYSDRKFATLSGKFQFMTEFDPLPSPEGEEGYPYQLMSVSPYGWLCSEMTPSDQEELTVILIHPEEAVRQSLADGDVVRVISSVGETKARLKLDRGQRQDTIVFPRGRWVKSGSSANLLTRDIVSKVGNGAPYYETKVRIERLSR